MDFLVIDDDKTFCDATCFLIDDAGHYAEGVPTGAAGLERLGEEKFDVVLLDVHLGQENGLEVLPQLLKLRPNLPVVMFTAQGTVDKAVEAMRRGAMDFLEKPFAREQFMTVLARVQRFQQLGRRIEQLQEEVKETRAQSPEPLFDFTAPAMREAMDILNRSAKTPASVLILGESGTGKSVMAKAVHKASHRADQPLVTVSCPSLSKELLESELFGHVRGAFTGAMKDHWGKVKAASGGTLFLDEVADLPQEIQPKLLRLLQEREYERVGENVTRTADVRVLAATNCNLKKRVADGSFREDLYFRLNVIAVEIPPLRDRQDDLLRFAEHYLQHFASQCGRKLDGFSDEAKRCLVDYPWPGNLRELRNAIERAAILSHESRVIATDLPKEIQSGQAHTDDATLPPQAGAPITLAQLEETHIRRVLEQAQSLVTAAEMLGIDQATLYRKRKRMGLT